MIKTLFFVFLICLFAVPSQARIDIVPQKIVIEGRERNGELTVLNLMDVAGTFRIEIVNFSQDEKGVYAALSNPLNADFNPTDIVRLSPRQFRIEPGGRQKVRLSLRKPGDLPEAEYRFHVKATRLAQEDGAQTNTGKNVNVLANIGVTIPVVVRHGQVEAQAKIGDISVIDPMQAKNNKPALRLNIERQGNASTIGILEVLWLQPGGQAKKIGHIKNMNIFTDISQRNIDVPLYEMPPAGAELTIRYSDSINKGQIFDEVSFKL